MNRNSVDWGCFCILYFKAISSQYAYLKVLINSKKIITEKRQNWAQLNLRRIFLCNGIEVMWWWFLFCTFSTLGRFHEFSLPKYTLHWSSLQSACTMWLFWLHAVSSMLIRGYFIPPTQQNNSFTSLELGAIFCFEV